MFFDRSSWKTCRAYAFCALMVICAGSALPGSVQEPPSALLRLPLGSQDIFHSDYAIDTPIPQASEGPVEILPVARVALSLGPLSPYTEKVVIELSGVGAKARHLPGAPSAFALALFGFLCASLMWQHRKWVAAFLAIISICSASFHAVPRLLKTTKAAVTSSWLLPARDMPTAPRPCVRANSPRGRARLHSPGGIKIGEPVVVEYAADDCLPGKIEPANRHLYLPLSRTPLPCFQITAYSLYARPPPLAA